MARFRYTAKDPKGGTLRAVEDAQSPRALAGSLRRRGLIAVSIQEIGGAARVAETVQAQKQGRVKTAEVADFFRQMATLIDAGVVLVQTLDILVDREQNPYFKQVLQTVKRDVESGSPFSDAIGKYPKAFPNYVVAMVQAAEEGGGMVNILEKLATYLEERAELAQKLKSASMYPVFIMSFFICAMLGIVFFLIPTFEDIFKSFNIELPLPTRILMGISRFLIDNLLIGIVLVAGTVVTFIWWSRTERGHYEVDKLKLRLPVVGGVLHKAIIARFCQTFGILLDSGVTVVTALSIAEKTADNAVFEEAIGTIRSGIMGGETIGREMERTGLFPKMLVSMISTGEQSGALGPMLAKAAKTYRREVEGAITGATALVEPVMIVGLGIIISLTVLATYLPIFKISTAKH